MAFRNYCLSTVATALALSAALYSVGGSAQSVNIGAIVSLAHSAHATSAVSSPAISPTSTAATVTSQTESATTAIPTQSLSSSASTLANALATASPDPDQLRRERRDRVLAIVFGSVLAALALGLAIFMVLMWRRRSTRSRAATGPATTDEESGKAHRPEQKHMTQDKWGHRDWPWISSTAKPAPTDALTGDEPLRTRHGQSVGPLSPHGGFWNASDQATMPLVTHDDRRRDSSATAPVSPISDQPARQTSHARSWASSSGDTFEKAALTGGHSTERTPRRSPSLDLGSPTAPAEMAGSPVERTDSFLRRLRHRSISTDECRPVAYPSQEELGQFDFGLAHDRAAGAKAEGTRRMPVVYVASPPPRDFVGFLDAQRRQSGVARRPLPQRNPGKQVIPGPWPGRKSECARRTDDAV